jgi:hypothetical protein
MSEDQAKLIRDKIKHRLIEAAFENALLFDKTVENLYKSAHDDDIEEDLQDLIDIYDELRRDWFTNIGTNPNELDAIVRAKLRNYYNRHRGDI